MTHPRRKALQRSCSEGEKLLLDMVLKRITPALCPDNPEHIVVAGSHQRLAVARIKELLAKDLAHWQSTLLVPTDAGRAWVSRYLSPAASAFSRQHRSIRQTHIEKDGVRRRVAINDAESPLAWLKSRQGKGSALISSSGFAAGERLRHDFTLAQMSPRITTNWVSPDQRSTAGDPVMFSDTIVAARQRMQNALNAVGHELQGILMDVVCFLKGLEQIEKERQWPARSAKVVLSLALEKLARHYGISEAATGSERSRGIRAWTHKEVKEA